MLPLMYAWSDSRRIVCEGISVHSSWMSAGYTLFAVTGGKGKLWANGREYVLSRGKCLVFGPGITLRLTHLPSSVLTVQELVFDCVSLTQAAPENIPALELPEGELLPGSFIRIEELAGMLFDNRGDKQGLAAYGNHARFQELIYLVLSEGQAGEERASLAAVERTIELVQQKAAGFTLQELADETGLSARQYSRIFRQLTGQSPIDYQIERRMEHAKSLLTDSGQSIHQVAHEAGFRDPFHFSRSFKRHTGVSPRLYTQLSKQTVRLVSHQFLGEMLALDIRPVGAPKQLLDCRFYDGYTEGIQAVGDSVVTPYMDVLSELRPDMIITFDGHHLQRYSKIAHTLDVAWRMPFFDRFRHIANQLGRLELAERWMEQYGRAVIRAQEKLAPVLAKGQTVSQFWMRELPFQFDAYLDVGVLYRDLGLKGPPAIEEARRLPGHPFKIQVPLDQLSAYAGDHLFVVISSDEESKREFLKLTESPQWKRLEAVRQGRVYFMNVDWVREDPLSSMRILEDVVRLMGANA
ncbi:helix-turn-helix domain-containing protein [Paenibacillus sp. JDR-2]|uniref:helix-turn-helix domain-containing protein n=1 Tax=Paenibacillus sp. (strain JDR-2) TaxID=324057 RepID=UPI000166AD50|nr:helix-turn-helix domain-containing protein [Paenibacillus sp. JDR-2]ACT04775.1 transcriptional regulator, AraC family [Paenibacillus sp. JDR-2]